MYVINIQTTFYHSLTFKFSFLSFLQAFRVLHLSDFYPPKKELGNMRRETLKTSSDNNVFLPSPVSSEFQFSTAVVVPWKFMMEWNSCLLRNGKEVHLRDSGRKAWCAGEKHKAVLTTIWVRSERQPSWKGKQTLFAGIDKQWSLTVL